ncbi:Uncharacterised protein [Mycobacteroides abscessus subsp. abscessus]|nr:Uncharacterised protein [Mycobacteroides abscessus subsp. abscessus]
MDQALRLNQYNHFLNQLLKIAYPVYRSRRFGEDKELSNNQIDPVQL